MAEYYVDLDDGTDTAGQGTSIGTAYGTWQFCIDDILGTHGKATYGDVIYVKGTGDGDLDLSGYATGLEAGVAFIARGRSTWDDGLRPLLDLNGNAFWSGAKTGVYLYGFEFTNWITSTYAFYLGEYCHAADCVLSDNNATYGVRVSRFSSVNNLDIDLPSVSGNTGIYTNNQGAAATNCKVRMGGGYCCRIGSGGLITRNHLIALAGATGATVSVSDLNQIVHNTIISSGTYGIRVGSASYDGHVITRNYIEGTLLPISFTSTGTRGNKIMDNRVYRSGGVTSVVSSGTNIVDRNNLELLESGLVPGTIFPKQSLYLYPGIYAGAKIPRYGGARVAGVY